MSTPLKEESKPSSATDSSSTAPPTVPPHPTRLAGGKKTDDAVTLAGIADLFTEKVLAPGDDYAMLTREEMVRIATAISYVGFSTINMRKILIEKGFTMNDVVKCVIIQSRIGNNISKLTDNVHDVTEAKAILSWAKKKGIVDKAVDNETLTFPRICMAFAPVTLKVRTEIKDQLQQQNFVAGCPVVMQTPVLACYANDGSVHAQWIEAFAVKIKDKKLSDDEAKKNANSFRQIAVSNVITDPALELKNANMSWAELRGLFGI